MASKHLDTSIVKMNIVLHMNSNFTNRTRFLYSRIALDKVVQPSNKVGIYIKRNVCRPNKGPHRASLTFGIVQYVYFILNYRISC
jgi:hypothetical protein